MSPQSRAERSRLKKTVIRLRDDEDEVDVEAETFEEDDEDRKFVASKTKK